MLLQGGETLTMTGSGTAASANVANGIAMSSNGNLALADGTGAASNYSLNSTVINVTQRPINLSGTKIYDGNTTLNNSIVSVSSGLIGIETLTLTGEVNTNNANVGSYSASGGTLNVGSTTINIANGSNGGLAANYAINDGTHNYNSTSCGCKRHPFI